MIWIQKQSEDQSKIAMQALVWVSRSKRPLRVDDLCHALPVEIGSSNFDSNKVLSIHTTAKTGIIGPHAGRSEFPLWI